MLVLSAITAQEIKINRRNSVYTDIPEGALPHDVINAIKEKLGPEAVECLQPLGGKKLCCTFSSYNFTVKALSIGFFTFKSKDDKYIPASSNVSIVRIRNLPHEVPNEFIASSLMCYGKVLNVIRETHINTKVFNGARRVRIDMSNPIPKFLNIGQFRVMANYPGMKRLCAKCREEDHLAAECKAIVCPKCDEVGHPPSDCKKGCKKCGGDHLHKVCKNKSFSAALNSGKEKDQVEEVVKDIVEKVLENESNNMEEEEEIEKVVEKVENNIVEKAVEKVVEKQVTTKKEKQQETTKDVKKQENKTWKKSS
ncbi:uncharacterized protein LOC143244406 [Tachypleus tridentatus]|uniref:uncharacterized protein LOC143244406 n=1 Tax=Tachypleus tridentatus TaxID=6853 RepID=UPI003FD61F0E